MLLKMSFLTHSSRNVKSEENIIYAGNSDAGRPWQRRPARGKNQPQRTARHCHELPKHTVALIGQLPWGACSPRRSEHWSFIRHVISPTMPVIGSIRSRYAEALHMEKTGKNKLQMNKTKVPLLFLFAQHNTNTRLRPLQMLRVTERHFVLFITCAI